MCDMTATSFMYVGLTMTSASSFQMLRGSVIIFTGIASVIFLKARLKWFQWFGMVVICGGLALVAYGDILLKEEAEKNAKNKEDGPSNEILGDIIVIVAQIVVSCQMVYEEKFLTRYNVHALQAVGLEGFFGFIVLTLVLIPLGYIPTHDTTWGHSPVEPYVVEDSVDGLIQLTNHGYLLSAFCLTTISIAFFNFAGISVTQELSATTRMVLDSVRTLIIWAVSLGLGWQKFHFLHVFGFIVLISGMMLYNDLLILPLVRKYILKQKSVNELPPPSSDKDQIKKVETGETSSF